MGWWSRDEEVRQNLPKPLQRAQTWMKHSLGGGMGGWWEGYVSEDPSIRRQQEILFTTAVVTSFGVGLMLGSYAQKHRHAFGITRIANWQDLPSSAIQKNGKGPTFRGRAVQVSDGDTFRFYHVPTYFHSATISSSTKVSEQTWPVRICTIDTPETAKFGKPGQAYGDEAKTALEKLLMGATSTSNRTVYINVLERDQYGRAVAQVHVGWWPFRKYADDVLLEKGLAEIYRGSGAVYGKEGLKHYESIEQKARSKQRGMWSLGDQRESAAEYKARTKT